VFERRARVPHFVVRSVDGATVDYRSIWQREQLLLICLDESATSDPLIRLAQDLATRGTDLSVVETSLVVTRESIAGLPCPALILADRYGEIFWTREPGGVTDADDVIDSLRVIQSRCG
jgi:hypothetical protein